MGSRAASGNRFVRAELAISAPPPHACCLRKSVHHCHESPAAATEQLVLHLGDCCNHGARQAVTTVRWAHAQPPATASFAQNVEPYLGPSSSLSPNTEVSRFQSARAPPHSSIAQS